MESLHYLLMKAHSSVNRYILNEASALGLSPGQPKVLECLARLGESNQKTIALSCEIEPATVGSILLRMERDGLIRRSMRDGNRRSLYVSLTPRGLEASRKMEAVFHQADVLASAGLSAEELEQLQSLLKTVCSRFPSPGKEGI